jgi:hypothetical protein
MIKGYTKLEYLMGEQSVCVKLMYKRGYTVISLKLICHVAKDYFTIFFVEVEYCAHELSDVPIYFCISLTFHKGDTSISCNPCGGFCDGN